MSFNCMLSYNTNEATLNHILINTAGLKKKRKWESSCEKDHLVKKLSNMVNQSNDNNNTGELQLH